MADPELGVIVIALPRNNYGEVLKAELRRQLDAVAAEDAAPAAS